MPQVLSGLGGVFNGGSSSPNDMGGGSSGGGFGGILGKILPMILGGAGVISNIRQGNQQNGIIDAYRALLQKNMNLTPEQISSGISALQQPLSTGLKQNVGNAVQGMMAERGLSQAPGLFNSALTQSLAPYALQSQQQAIDAFFKGQSLPMGIQFPYGSLQRTPANLTGIMQQLMSQFGQRGVINVPGAQPGLTPPALPGGLSPNNPWSQLPGLPDPIYGGGGSGNGT